MVVTLAGLGLGAGALAGAAPVPVTAVACVLALGGVTLYEHAFIRAGQAVPLS
jgi:hypothetical protein